MSRKKSCVSLTLASSLLLGACSVATSPGFGSSGSGDTADTAAGINYNPSWAPWDLWDRWEERRVAEDLDRARTVNASWIRVALPWRLFRLANPSHDTYRALFGRFLDLAEERGLKIVPILYDEYCTLKDGYRAFEDTAETNCWHHWEWNEEVKELAGSMGAVFGNRNGIAMWDLANEPDRVSKSEYIWNPEHRANRLEWLRNTYVLLHQVQSKPVIVGVNFEQTARDVIQAGAADVASLHYYPQLHGNRDIRGEVRRLKRLGKPVMIEEAGLSSSDQLGGSDDAQQHFICDMVTIAQSEHVGLMLWHLQAKPGDRGWESELGLYDANGILKPGGQAFQTRCWTQSGQAAQYNAATVGGDPRVCCRAGIDNVCNVADPTCDALCPRNADGSKNWGEGVSVYAGICGAAQNPCCNTNENNFCNVPSPECDALCPRHPDGSKNWEDGRAAFQNACGR